MPVFWILVFLGILVLIAVSSWLFIPLGKLAIHWVKDFWNVLDYNEESEDDKNE